MTRAGVLALLSALVLGAAALLFGLPELFLVAAVCGGLIVLAGVTVSLRPPLRAACDPGRRRVPCGTPLQIQIRLRNVARRRAAAAADIFDDSSDRPGPVLRLGRMPSGAIVEDHYHLATHRRGWRETGPVWLEAEDAFGLARRRHRLAPPGRVLVWPEIADLAALPDTVEQATERRRNARLVAGTATDFHSLRRFEPGDDPHRIHWPSSTRYQELLVRRFETVQQPETLLFLDTGQNAATPETFERMVSAAAGLAVMASAESGSVRLLTSSGAEVRATGPPTGVLDALALVAQAPAGRGAARLPVGAARMILLAVVGGGVDHPDLALDRLDGRRIILSFWQDEPPEEHRDVLAVGPHESVVERWDAFRMVRDGTPAR
ncbi:MAG: DUF58 domain-containing protein [bacterium]|nr:DUF58 domain-containing protein [bacterium]